MANWQTWQRIYEESQKEKEEPQIHEHVWYVPFHRAITSGLVQRGYSIPERNTDNGIVSDQPE